MDKNRFFSKKHLMICILLTCSMIVFCSCENKTMDSENVELDLKDDENMIYNDENAIETETENIDFFMDDKILSEEEIDWIGVTETGVNEELFLKNLDLDMLEYVAEEIQILVQEEYEAEKENPEILLKEGWTRVFDSEHYKNVLGIGTLAEKPLYWIIYKSPNNGIYEYICATALYTISGINCELEDGTLTWNNAKEFLNQFTTMILDGKGLSVKEIE